MKFQFNVRGKITEVDKDVYDSLFHRQHEMILMKGYVYLKDGGKRRALHRLIMNAPTDSLVDHVDRNPLNNKRENLRLATRSQNAANRKGNGSSKFFGVTKVSKKYKGTEYTYWAAKVKKDGKVVFQKSFKDEEEAARAYDLHAKQHHGDFANLNFPENP